MSYRAESPQDKGREKRVHFDLGQIERKFIDPLGGEFARSQREGVTLAPFDFETEEIAYIAACAIRGTLGQDAPIMQQGNRVAIFVPDDQVVMPEKEGPKGRLDLIRTDDEGATEQWE